MPKLYTEPIAGFRTWLMDEKEPLIKGVVHNLVWPSDEDPTAECRKHHRPTGEMMPGKRKTRHKVPSLKCQCGFWAYEDYATLQKAGNYCWGSMIKSVRGVMIAWGRVQLTERGFRAEHARPVALLEWRDRRHRPQQWQFDKKEQIVRDFWNDRLEKIATTYNVPLLGTEQELIEFAVEAGTPIGA